MNNIEKITVNSSIIKDAEYVHDEKLMTIYFNNGGVYKYPDMPIYYWKGFYESTSKGQFLNKFIFGKFPFNTTKK